MLGTMADFELYTPVADLRFLDTGGRFTILDVSGRFWILNSSNRF